MRRVTGEKCEHETRESRERSGESFHRQASTNHRKTREAHKDHTMPLFTLGIRPKSIRFSPMGAVIVLLIFTVHAGKPEWDNRHIIDSHGRITIYHGVNVANYSKHAPGSLPWHTREDFARLNRWGLNLVRYLLFWHAIEPRQGHYDTAYVESTRVRIGWLRELGIDVLLDMHQDLYTKRFTGDGFPEWTVNDEGKKFERRTPWSKNYFQPAVKASYRNFWKSDTLKKQYIDALCFVVEQTDTFENVMGIDVMNEPYGGYVLRRRFERRRLSAFYARILKEMRDRGFRMRMVFEPAWQSNSFLSSRLKWNPDTGCIYAPHYYDPLCHEGKAYGWFNRRLLKRAFRTKSREARRFNVPLIMGEFGISQEVRNYQGFVRDYLRECEKRGAGWCYYAYDKLSHSHFGLLDDDGTRRRVVEELVRIYPQKIAGREPRIIRTDSSFTLTYSPVDIDSPTVIFVPAEVTVAASTANGEKRGLDGRLLNHTNDGPERQRIEIVFDSKKSVPD